MRSALLLSLASLHLARGSEVPEKRATQLQSITIKGKAFYKGNDRFYIRGVDYQPGGSSANTDPLADESICNRDIPYFQKLGLNTIRVYAVDNSKNHDACMQALANAGIYLALDVNNPNYSINRADPGPSYNPTYLQSVFATVDAFAGYSNTLLYFSANEVINAQNTTTAAPYVKAVTRDMKQYIGERGYRNIPVGYSAADVSQNQYLMGQYMSCGDAPSQGDFYAINNYEWCSPSSFEKSGWSSLVDQYKNYSQPLFFSEYGCIKNHARDFSETVGLYQTDMTAVNSGGLVYQYSEEGAGYGLVTISGSTVTPIGDQVTDLMNALKNTPDPSGSGDLVTSGTVTQNCPPQSDNWDTTPWTGSALPAMPSGAEQYMKNGAGKGPGFSGGSQNAGGASSQTAAPNAGQVTATYGNGSPSQTGKSAAVPLARPAGEGLVMMGCAFAAVVVGTLLL